ncbi:dihydrodipicolinate reductase [Mycolicibacterium insubricum]|uniref:Dihydrodipicolinate reductase n=1 Tax=Mycolicibacterium insubricum TaxID=444597 RepID=A0A1X0DLN0_9MYCO|nr:dihydrodipicolinate reductase [Mycolicibacterium insubricum]MCB9442011.1 dihydrodipicolinate reductase [Mycolicibacterium sp.]ORA73062.1 dihydrodipicolinate reductase [Mycolicibacterium insubricum]BBZ68463.1 dihydrodipicolinate reductase [Mycolicibacterium insubricum]
MTGNRRRVIQWATGGVGVAAIRGVVEHPDLQLVGCWVHSPAKNGRDAGELAGIGPIGVAATSSVEEILDADADAVIYAPLLPDSQQVAAILRSGKNVITPVGWFYPRESEAAPLRAAALEGGVTLHGTGIAPGGFSDKFLLQLSALSTGISFVRAEEFSDLRSYLAPDVLRHVMGFGGAPEEALGGMMQKLLDGGFIQAINLVVDELGFAADPRILGSQQVAVATAPIDSPIGVIEPGQVAARRFTWEALVDGQPVVQVSVNWLMGEQHLDPSWTFGPEGQRYEVEVRGEPDFTFCVKGFHGEIGPDGEIGEETGITGTAAHCVNSVPAVCAAAPGIATYRDLPLLTGKAAPSLSR